MFFFGRREIDMKYIEARIIIKIGSPAFAEEMIVSIFSDLGVKGVVIEDPDDGLQTIWDKTGRLPTEHAVIGYFPADSSGNNRCGLLQSALANLRDMRNIDTTTRYRSIDEEDWAESWKDFFWPEKISNQIVVKPSWREYAPAPGEIVVEIDPGMAFGTGTHPTTTLCIRLLEKVLQPRQRILDVGTGSGILLVSAAKLGACSGIGVDNDCTATRVALSNLKRNHLDPARFSVAAGNLIDPVHDRFDLVTANILTSVILELIPPLHRVLKPGGLFICSGIIKAYGQKVETQLEDNGFRVLEKQVEDDWVCFAAGIGDHVNK